jgi:hypothetical protein
VASFHRLGNPAIPIPSSTLESVIRAMTSTQPRTPGSLLCDTDEELSSSQWVQLEKGRSVIVQRNDEPPLAGKVDTRTEDASVLWVWLDDGLGRIAVYADEGARIWLPKS